MACYILSFMGKIGKSFLFFMVVLSLCLISTIGTAENVLTVAGPWDPAVDPHVSGYSLQRLGVTETLVDVDQSVGLIPGLASNWQVSGDQLTWTFIIRDGVKFHDGSFVNAHTAEKSLEDSLKKSKTFAKVPIKDITALNDKTLEISLNSAFPALPAYMAKGESAILSEACLAQGDITSPVSTGPFKFVSFSPKEEMITASNPDYWGKKPSVDQVVYISVPEAATRSLLLESGDADIVQIMPADVTESFKSKSGFTVKSQPIARTREILYNFESGPFADQTVRQAMNYAIDRQAIVDYVMEGVGSPAAGMFPPEFYWANSNIQPFSYDPEKAKSMLEQAGWKDSDGDGILDKNREKFSITLVTYPERAELPPTAEVIQDQLKDTGIEVEIVVVDNDSSTALREKGDYDMYLMGRGLLFVPDPDEVMMTDYHSSRKDNEYGGYKWSNARVDELIDQARKTNDMAERKKLYDEVQQIVVDEAPVSYLNYYVNQDITSDKVSGYRMHPTEMSYHLEDVTLG